MAFGALGDWGPLITGLAPASLILIGGDVELATGEAFVELGYSADDNGNNVTHRVQVDTSSINIDVPGQYNVTYTVWTVNGINTVATRAVTVTALSTSDDYEAFYNTLTLNAFLAASPYGRPLLNLDRGSIYKNRDGKMVVTFDNGATDAGTFTSVEFAFYTLAGQIALFSRDLDNGIDVVGGKLHITLPRQQMALTGRVYFEIIIEQGGETKLLESYVHIVNTRIN